MAGTLRNRTGRRLARLGAVALAVLALAWGERRLATTLRATELISGWMLFALVTGLTLLNARKRLPFLPLGRAASWLEWHVDAGLVALALFWLHAGARLPAGRLDATVAAVFALAAASGVAGLLLSRSCARRLTSRGREVIFERIPTLRRELRERAEQVVLAAAEKDGSTALADFHARRLRPFFDAPRDRLRHLLESGRPRQLWQAEFAALERYLDESERARARELAELVRAKQDLDYHHALQGALKLWLFVHVPASYALIVLGLFHGLLAQAFSAGAR